jgi:hypothetical protein
MMLNTQIAVVLASVVALGFAALLAYLVVLCNHNPIVGFILIVLIPSALACVIMPFDIAHILRVGNVFLFLIFAPLLLWLPARQVETTPAVIALPASGTIPLGAAPPSGGATPVPQRSCPHCGFSYAFNGVECRHCGARSPGPPAGPPPSQT